MASLVLDIPATPRARASLGGLGTPRELTNGAPCLGLALGLAALTWAGVSAVVLLLVRRPRGRSRQGGPDRCREPFASSTACAPAPRRWPGATAPRPPSPACGTRTSRPS